MMAGDTPRAAVLAPAAGGRARAYLRLAKIDIIDYHLSLPLVWALLAPAARIDPAVARTLLLFLLSQACLIAAMVAFDDVTGYRDGSDAVNYAPDAPARKLARKPLLTGALSAAQAVRFGWAAAAVGGVLLAATVLTAPVRPVWVLAAAAAYLVLSVQYSWGIKVSYHGGQELYLVVLGVAVVVIPYGLITGGLGVFVAVQAVLFGLGPLLFGVYSNTADVAGDRRVGRPTVAALTSGRGNAVFVGAVSAAEAALIIGAALAGVAPWWFPIALAPVIVLRAVQYATGMARGHILAARRLGIGVHRLAVALLIVVNLIDPPTVAGVG